MALHQLTRPFAMFQGGFSGAVELRVVFVQQGVHGLAQRLQLAPAVQALGALVPVDDVVFQVAHQDGVLRLVQQRRLVADAGIGRLALDLCRGPGRKNLQGGGDKVRVGQRLAEQHENGANHLPVGTAQLLACKGACAHLAAQIRARVMLQHMVGHHVLPLRQQLHAGGAFHGHLKGGLLHPVDDGGQADGAGGLAGRLAHAHHTAGLRAQRLGHVGGQLHKKCRAGTGRHRRRHLDDRILNALLRLVGTQAGDAEGQVVGQVLQQRRFLRADVQDFRGVQVQQAKGLVLCAQGQANHAVKTVVQHALGPVAQVVALAQVVHDHGLAAAHRLTGRPSAGGAVFVPAHAQLVQILVRVASVGHPGNRFVFVVVGKAHPAHAVAANVHRDLADGLQQGRFRRRAHQGFVAGTQQLLGTRHARDLALGPQALGHVHRQHLAGGHAVEADASRSHFCVKQAAVLAQLQAQCGHMPTV